jgi:hypothetical protein
MTSAPSLRQRSSGNSPFIFIAVVLLLCSGCELFQKLPEREDTATNDREELDPIPGRRVYDPETGTYVEVEAPPTEPIDTIQWTDVRENQYPPITEEGVPTYTPPPGTVTETTGTNPVRPIGTAANGSQLLSAYNVDFMLPFLASRMDATTGQIDPNSEWALHFFSGAQMAFDELRQTDPDLALNVRVDDTQADANRTRELLSSTAFRAAHLVLGPYRRANVSLVAETVKQTGQVLVSPYSASSGVSDNNPNYIQVNPTLETHCRAQLRHALETYAPDRIVLVARNLESETARFQYFQEAYRVMQNDAQVDPLEELVLDEAVYDLTPWLDTDPIVFIVPVWDESFVASFLRQLNAASRTEYRQVYVYGMPQWKDYERVDYELYEACNVHLSTSTFIDPLDEDIREFRRDFYDRFGTLPREEAYVGYDVTKYFSRMLQKHGTRFQYQLESEPADLLHTRFRFERVIDIPEVTPGGIEQPVIERFENKYLNILHFKNFQFRKVN